MKTRSLLMLALIALALPAAAEPLELHVVVRLPPSIEAMNAAEFGISNLPFDQCYIEAEWDTDLIIGSLEEGGIALAFLEPLSGPIAHLGVLRFTCLEPIGDDYLIEVVGSSDWGNLVVVNADDYSQVDALGYFFCFNRVSWEGNCYFYGYVVSQPTIYLSTQGDGYGESCADLLPETTPVGDSSWGSIKSLY